MKTVLRILSLTMVVCMLFSSCAQAAVEIADTGAGVMHENESLKLPPVEDNGAFEHLSSKENGATAPKAGTYAEDTVLVKCDGDFSDALLGELAFISAEPLFAGSVWYNVKLADGAEATDAVEYLLSLDIFDAVDYDYVMHTGVVDVSSNPHAEKQTNLGVHNIPYGWTQNGKHPGGSPDVIIAVIDTGVDYNHIDLAGNIWVNSAEIPDNGRDDDGNGYVDDIHGWDCVGNDKDPMDDNGHGTHVAGIIAAENNKVGGIGIAYGCKVMVLKAGNSSGYFNNSDIAEAVQYAYMNGASVINMSFGGGNISIAVEEALENAYTTSVLVAAAGNDGACNNLACKTCDIVAVSYPAALPYVIGVMSCDASGKYVSSFSNYDHNPYNTVEYEVYAVGEAVDSTWPGNKYACLNGTSMAAPTVSGIAALLRSYYSDREVYSTKFIQSQIVNTGSVNPINARANGTDGAHSVSDVYEALTKLPKPEVNLYDYHIDDSVAISEKNNGNEVIDAGETVRLYIELHNRGGVATDVNVSIDTYRSEIGDETMTDPYFTFVNSAIELSDIGTYSVRESGDKYFEIIVDGDCPNDYLVNFNIRYTYKNGMDEKDTTVYTDDGKQKAQFNVSRGFYLPATITEDTTYKADRLYIVGEDVVIPEGITVTFEAGCKIQFYDDREYYSSPEITVYGSLNMLGTRDAQITIAPNERYSSFGGLIKALDEGDITIQYADAINMFVNEYLTIEASPDHSSSCQTEIYHSSLKFQGDNNYYVNIFNNGQTRSQIHFTVDEISSCYVQVTTKGLQLEVSKHCGNYIAKNVNTTTYFWEIDTFRNNVLMAFGENRKNAGGGFRCFGRAVISNNMITSLLQDKNYLIQFEFGSDSTITNNAFSPIYRQYASQTIQGYYDSTGTPIVDVYGSLADASLLWPYVVSVEMFDKDGNAITRVGKEEIKVRVTFNRPMDKNAGTYLTFGTIEPYGDYRIDGEYISDTVWEGTYTLKAQIENGQNFLKVNNAWAAEDQTKTVFGEYQLHEFTIDTTAAMAMNLMAFPQDDGIKLTFAQDDYDTLLGYNVYRAESKNGNYVKLNPVAIPANENTFLDENAEPGKTYWYTYTVVLSDFTESNPAGRVQATAKDTVLPNMYHTPVNQGYAGNNLVISCTASDNVAISAVTLYYRAVGASEWKALTMAKQNDKYSATVFGSDVTLAGLEYYLVAYDEHNSIARGSADAPYTVVVKEASAISRLGDVDGDGTITAKDALMIMQTINEERILTDDEFMRADLNGDGVLNSTEALRILQYINGNVTDLEM